MSTQHRRGAKHPLVRCSSDARHPRSRSSSVESATALEGQCLGERCPLVDDVVDPAVETTGTDGVEEKSAVIATVETNPCTCGLRRAGNHDDLMPVMRVGQPGYGSGFSLRRLGCGAKQITWTPRGAEGHAV